MRHRGSDRREHTCFVTTNCEYHTRRGVCVAVRDRRSTVWMANHRAVGLNLDVLPPGTAYVGRPLVFRSDTDQVQTSLVVDINRPNRTIVDAYEMVRGLLPF
jgi:hypothetical protein